jgi:hypothetical protein
MGLNYQGDYSDIMGTGYSKSLEYKNDYLYGDPTGMSAGLSVRCVQYAH